jgi:pimeloyl-ACP methyl ester carboxylesterase
MTPVVLAPGLLCDDRLWSRLRPLLERPVVALDFTRLGRMEEMAEAILREAPRRFVLAGFSMGGMAAMLAASCAPERVAALVLIDTHAEPETPNRKARRVRQIESAVSGDFDALVYEELKPAYFSPGTPRPVEKALVAEMAFDLGPDVFRRHGLALMSRPDPSPLLKHLTMPVTVITGRDDQLAPPVFAESLARTLANGRLVVLDGCGHMAPLEQPQSVAAEIERAARMVEEQSDGSERTSRSVQA